MNKTSSEQRMAIGKDPFHKRKGSTMVLRIVTAPYDSSLIDLEVNLLEQMSRNVCPANADIISVVLGIKKGKEPDVPLKPFDIVDVGESSLFSGKGMSDYFKNIFRSSVGVITSRAIIY